MTEKRPSHPLLRSLPLLAVAAGVLATACAVAGEGGPGSTSRQAVSTPDTRAPAAPASGSARHLDTVVVAAGGERDPDAGFPGFVPRLPIQLGENGNLRYHPAVDRLTPGSSPWNAGLRDGDTILAVNGIDARRPQAWKEMMGRRIGTPYTLRVRRGGEEREIRAEVVPARYHPRSGSTTP